MLDKFFNHISYPSYKRTISLLVLFLITLSIPVTLTLIQKRIETTQWAQEGTSACEQAPYDCTYETTYPQPGGEIHENCDNISEGTYDPTHNIEVNVYSCPDGNTRYLTRDVDAPISTPTGTGGEQCGQCWYTEENTSCPNGIQYISGHGCNGLNCSGCTYDPGCSTTTCNPPGITPSPSITISNDINSFPRPAADTGLGIHWSANVGGGYDAGTAQSAVCVLKSMGMSWIKILADAGSAVDFARIMKINDIEPIVRFYRHQPEPGTLRPQDRDSISAYVSAGVNYFQSKNEPNLAVEWQGENIPACDQAADRTMETWVQDAFDIQTRGGIPLFPPYAPGSNCAGNWSAVDFLNRSMEWLRNNNCTLPNMTTGNCLLFFDAVSTNGKPAVMGIHNYSLNHDNARDGSGNIVFYTSDANGFLMFTEYDRIIRGFLGRSIPILASEDGNIIGNNQDSNYPTTDVAWHRDVHVAIANYQKNHTTPYFFNTAFWLSTPNNPGETTWAGTPAPWFDTSLTPLLPETINALVNMTGSESSCIPIVPIGTDCVYDQDCLPGQMCISGRCSGGSRGGDGEGPGLSTCTNSLQETRPDGTSYTTPVLSSNCSSCIITFANTLNEAYDKNSPGATQNCTQEQLVSYWCNGGWCPDDNLENCVPVEQCKGTIMDYCKEPCFNPQGVPPPLIPAPTYTQRPTTGFWGFFFSDISPTNIPSGPDALSNVSNTFVSLLVALGVIFSVALIIYSGIKFITAGGDKEKIESAKKALTYAIVGLLIIVLSFAIIRLLGNIIGARFNI